MHEVSETASPTVVTVARKRCPTVVAGSHAKEHEFAWGDCCTNFGLEPVLAAEDDWYLDATPEGLDR
ncbi:hypothetical protein CDAR_63521 [Caerostris darwini]|uniref:Uncharacterized protein n=1 Tax=Caerostris darwini TaxID=1538125 RepID=A0AAV4QE59_9ARAC|nr:hypothetical protein CDAR_63521 [Caerostris darwini]